MLFFEYSVQSEDSSGNLPTRALALIQGVEETNDRDDADRVYTEVIENLLSRPGTVGNTDIGRLKAALAADGFEFLESRLVPFTPGLTSQGNPVSAMELKLARYGLETELTHYKQAVDNFVDGNWESTNSQIRSFFEGLLPQLCLCRTGQSSKGPIAALQHLRNQGELSEKEFNLLRAFWNAIQGNGPHSGQSLQEEAHMRLQVATSLADFLMSRLVSTENV